MKPIIERGASWTIEETKMLLSLWGHDMVQRQSSNKKRTKKVYEKISERFIDRGYERTPDQVRTRVFNMIAEYRRILKAPTQDKKKKCVFFEALHRIYQAKDAEDVKNALNDYEPDYPINSTDFFCSDNETSTAGAQDDQMDDQQIDSDIEQTTNDQQHLPQHHQQQHPQQQPQQTLQQQQHQHQQQSSSYPTQVNTFDVTSSALLIDRMFAHLTKDSENMREWIKLEKERLALESARRRQEAEHELKRERFLLDGLARMQQQMFEFMTKMEQRDLQPQIVTMNDSPQTNLSQEGITSNDEDPQHTASNQEK